MTMIQFQDFVPKMVAGPGFLKLAEYESFEEAIAAANQWIEKKQIQVISLETVVLPNIWNKWEEGTTDASLGTSGESPSHWHQFLRVWYQDEDSKAGIARQ
jgi:hypothetical protein